MEIERLHEMLTEAGIEHEWLDRTPPGWEKLGFGDEYNWGYQVCVYKPDGERLISAIEGCGTYGYADWSGVVEGDLIEIMGLLTPEEEEDGECVAGWLTAEDVFERIRRAVSAE